MISDPSLLDGYMEGASQGQQEKYVHAALSGTMMSDPTTVNEDVMGGKWDAHLTPSQKLSFGKLSQAAMERIERENAAQVEVEQRQYANGMNEEIAFIEANGAAPADSQYTNETIDAMSGGDSEWATEMKRVRDEATTQAEAVHAVSSAMPIEIEARITELTDAVKEPGHTDEDVGRLNAYANALSDRNQKVREDAATYIQGSWDNAERSFNVYEGVGPEDKGIAA
ncbi:unnamed protein product, partial [marine sediment metagenome]